jgi:hypothetical protein
LEFVIGIKELITGRVSSMTKAISGRVNASVFAAVDAGSAWQKAAFQPRYSEPLSAFETD